MRNDEQLQSVLAALVRWSDSIALCGIEIYEGVLNDEASIRGFLQHAVAVTRKLAEEKRFRGAPILLSGAGSAWYDVVADVFSAADFSGSVEIVLRPGCYLTHDVGSYRKAQGDSPAQSHRAANEFRPLARPPDMGLCTIGSRNKQRDHWHGQARCSLRLGIANTRIAFQTGNRTAKAAPAHWVVTKMMDQHAYLQIDAEDDLRVGDMIGFDISHPCLTFDKWRTLPILNATYDVIDLVNTYF